MKAFLYSVCYYLKMYLPQGKYTFITKYEDRQKHFLFLTLILQEMLMYVFTNVDSHKKNDAK